jgi:radical SAM protein with 4Fe4S-binding SPASM domain
LVRIAQSTDKLRVRITVTEKSVRLMPETVSYLASLGAKLIHFECVNIAGRALDLHQEIRRPTAEEFANNFLISLEVAKASRVSLMHAGYGRLFFPSVYMCEGVSGHRLAISPSGFISHCLEVQDFDHPLSILMKAGSVNFAFKTIVISSDLRNRHFLNHGVLQKCEECFCRYICSNGCPSRNYHMMGDPFMIDNFYCISTQLIIKHLLERIYAETKEQGLFRTGDNFKVWNIITPSEYMIEPNNRISYKEILTADIV